MKYIKAIAISMLLWSCGNSSNSGNNESHKHPDESSVKENIAFFKDVDASITTQLNLVLQHYMHLKNSLVASNSLEAKAGAIGMLDAITVLDTLKLTPDQKKFFNEENGKIKEGAKHIAESEEIEHQREHLNELSEGTFKLIKAFGCTKMMYFEFCPMANDHKGGYWLSESEEIKNPYFGDKMLSCGEVKETVR